MTLRIAKYLLPAIIIGIIGGFTAAFVFSNTTFTIDGFTFSAGMEPSLKGETVLSLPPFGSVSGTTHPQPVRLRVALDRVSLEEVRRLAMEPLSKQRLLASMQVEAVRVARWYALRMSVVALLGSLLLALAVFRWEPLRLSAACLAGIVAVWLMAGSVARSYDIKAFRQPRYYGALASAPWLMNTVETKLSDLRAFRKQAGALAGDIHDFYRRVGRLPAAPSGPGQAVILHVGDIHNNPLGLDFTRKIAKDFAVDAVIDTGDITDFGTPVETRLVDRIAALKVPYVFVGGNHDSPAVLQRLGQLPNVRLAGGKIVEVAGVRVMGFDDPVSTTEMTQVSQTPKQAASLARKFAAAYRRARRKPDIVAVHEPRDGALLAGKAKVVISGHSHKASLKTVSKTVFENVGTTGAAGIRGLGGKSRKAYTLAILRFEGTPKRLVAVDTITIDALRKEFTVQRTTIVRR